MRNGRQRSFLFFIDYSKIIVDRFIIFFTRRVVSARPAEYTAIVFFKVVQLLIQFPYRVKGLTGNFDSCLHTTINRRLPTNYNSERNLDKHKF